MKRCARCKEEKPLIDFSPCPSKRDGRGSYCRRCSAERAAERRRTPEYAAMLGTPEWRSLRNDWAVKSRKASPRATLNFARRRALERLPTDNPVTTDGLMEIWTDQSGRCAISGLAMTWCGGKQLPTSVSLDRIDQSGGYTKCNLRLVCHAVNAFRGIMSDVEMLHMAKAIVSHMSCSECGALPASRPKGIAGLCKRKWRCDDCGAGHDRDVNAARNILRAGQSALIGGAHV